MDPTVITIAPVGDSNSEPATGQKTPALIVTFFTIMAIVMAGWTCVLGWTAVSLLLWLLA